MDSAGRKVAQTACERAERGTTLPAPVSSESHFPIHTWVKKKGGLRSLVAVHVCGGRDGTSPGCEGQGGTSAARQGDMVGLPQPLAGGHDGDTMGTGTSNCWGRDIIGPLQAQGCWEDTQWNIHSQGVGRNGTCSGLRWRDTMGHSQRRGLKRNAMGYGGGHLQSQRRRWGHNGTSAAGGATPPA